MKATADSSSIVIAAQNTIEPQTVKSISGSFPVNSFFHQTAAGIHSMPHLPAARNYSHTGSYGIHVSIHFRPVPKYALNKFAVFIFARVGAQCRITCSSDIFFPVQLCCLRLFIRHMLVRLN